MRWCKEYIKVIDELYRQIDSLANTRGHTARIPTILYDILLRITDPEVECLETDEAVEMDQEELIKMIKKAYLLVHE